MSTPIDYRAERLAARAATYRANVARLRALAGVAPEPSPAPDVASEPADDAAAHPGREPQDVEQRAGEPDRPETACAADGCFRPTRDGICDRCATQ